MKTTNGVATTRQDYTFRAQTKLGAQTTVSYAPPIYVRDQPDWNEFISILTSMKPDHITLVADDGLPDLLVTCVFNTLNRIEVPVLLVRLDVNEPAKTMNTVEALINQARENGGGTHASLFVTLGGGLVGNIAGLAASLMVRGVKLVHVPTTLLAGTDSVLSFKQGVNRVLSDTDLLIKNLLGTFKAPECVVVYLSLWQTLPADEIRAGLCELVKNVVAISPHLYNEVSVLLNPEAFYALEDYFRIFQWCFETKYSVMRYDAHEQGSALVLEYGHTVGHALEALTGMKHGLAIGLGMLVAAQISVARGALPVREQEKLIHLLKRNGAPIRLAHQVSLDAVMERIRYDNKIGYLPHKSGHHVMVLLERFGQPALQDTLPLCYVSEEELRRSIASIQEPERGVLDLLASIQTGKETTNVNL